MAMLSGIYMISTGRRGVA